MKKADMRTRNRLAERGKMFGFRAKIPSDFLGHYAPKKEIVVSLRQSERRVAIQIAREKSAALNHEFAQLRK